MLFLLPGRNNAVHVTIQKPNFGPRFELQNSETPQSHELPSLAPLKTPMRPVLAAQVNGSADSPMLPMQSAASIRHSPSPALGETRETRPWDTPSSRNPILESLHGITQLRTDEAKNQAPAGAGSKIIRTVLDRNYY